MSSLKKIFLLTGMLIGLGAAAQNKAPFKGITAFSWEMGFPFDKKYLDEPSFSGWRLEYRKMINAKFSAGLALSWNAFDQNFGKKTYYSKDGVQAVTTDMIRQVYTVPITAIAHYYPSVKSKLFMPFVGIGLGTQYTEFNTYFNIYQIQEKNWGFVARPELGTLLNFGESEVKGIINIGYNYATNQYDDFDISHVSHLTVSLGIAIAY